ncbi:MAG: DNA polymerase III subunit delta [Acidimicrobiia bacterium]
MGWYAVTGPKNAGPSERERMFARAAEMLAEAGVDAPTRIDVPQKGSGSSDDGATMRDDVQGVIPALQSGSLFGGTTGVLVVDANHLLKAEVDTIAELLTNADQTQAVAVFLSMGALPAAIRTAVKASGGVETIKQFNERDAASWLADESKRRGLRVDQAARGELLNHFGSNTSAMARALDQLSISGTTISAEDVKSRFTARPDEPMWFLGDAIMSGDQGEALRRLSDFLQHQHPLVLLSYLEGEVKKRSLAAIAPDYETFTEWAGANPNSYATKKVWQSKNRAPAQGLAKSVRALAKADLTLKTQPEATHRVTLERLTVAMCRWMA